MNTNFVTNTKISKETIIQGLRFLVKSYNEGLTYNKIIEGLRRMNCDFSIYDVRLAFPNTPKMSVVEGLRMGNFMCAASVIANVMQAGNYNSWEYTCLLLLGNGDESPICQFLRTVDSNNKNQESGDSIKTR